MKEGENKEGRKEKERTNATDTTANTKAGDHIVKKSHVIPSYNRTCLRKS